ncbi:glycosyltransferase family 2 protein [uncultured Winogradskyella sp.]|uniref:glycosyltransferase family 2 protein n=1 Tax=uncultured Winogradskyella sp. TaxID=395353 RepID=UPI002610D09B|nr:glycosyltransferase family 2 protein [uncultured Winogradskyella sp.]|tara:strand:+ start:1106 stop:2152 length:1047 start_codon:yes stop_codon:yes gene_type:complete
MISNQIPISLITTFYNEEILLSRCLDSILNQTYKNFEIILINDGSTDLSLEIAEKYVSKFNDVKLISTVNLGHAEARNLGLKNATGRYVTFLDADDELEAHMMLQFYNKTQEQNIDLIISDFKAVDEIGNNELTTKWNKAFLNITSTQELAHLMYTEKIQETIWAKLFKTEIAKEISFNKGLWFDDRPFLIEFLFLSKTVDFIHEKLVINYARKSSITRRVLEKKRIEDVYYLFNVELDIIERCNQNSFYKKSVFKNTLDFFIITYLIQIIDNDKILNIKEVQDTFQIVFGKFRKNIKNESIKFNFKKTVQIYLLTLPKYIGWSNVNLLLSLFKKKSIQHIKKLKDVD